MGEKKAKNDAQINLFLPADLLAALEDARWAAKVSRSEYVREAIRQRLARRQAAIRRRQGGGGR